ncbi:MAG: hypothetical protein WCO33_01790 [bacterium]
MEKESQTKHIPFPQIPRFPGEGPLIGAPTAETTIFYPEHVEILTEISKYIDPKTSFVERKGIADKLSDAEDIEPFNLLMDCLQKDASRRRIYLELTKLVKEGFDRKNTDFPEKSDRYTFPTKSIDLVNKALRMAFGSDFKSLIPSLSLMMSS